ncbi:MAG TPA: hypothetical protein DE315_00005 [Candidatus Omnitrophica bacterium]|nr:MAG: hypothetical protein A2Y05_00690 [Omnitrophica WOR_2 bacterium GWA2_53_43]HBO97080.1 hypothetical protein [Candidatus Omnitrophota bacterium]HCI43914.1 hypothetical protein [Candidatus Omnitrophota bacterium]
MTQADYDVLKNLDIETIPFSKRIEAFYEGTRAAADLAQQVMIPQLKALMNPSRKEEILKGLYFRMYAWMRTLVSLNDTVHFQAAASATRSIFELLLDIKLIMDDNPKGAIQKFNAFVEVEKFRMAKGYVDFKNRNPALRYVGDRGKENLVNKQGEQERIEKLRALHWGNDSKGRPIIPKHWSGWPTNKRAEEAGKHDEFFYCASFGLLSWYTHSGPTGVQGMSKEALEAVFGNSHMLAQPMFLDATLLVAKEFKLITAIPQLTDRIKEAGLAVGTVILDEHIKQLKDLENKKG